MDLAQLLAEQDAVVRRDQALQHLSSGALRHRLGRGRRWQRLLPAVYLAASGEPSRRQLLLAGLLHGGDDAQLSGLTALEVHGLRPAPDQRVHVLVPHHRHVASCGHVVVQRTHRLPPPLCLQGLPVTPVARAVVEACRRLPDLGDVRAVVAGAVQRRRTTVERLELELAEGHSAGSALVRRALREVADGVRSAPEAELRALFRRSRVLPAARWNCRLLLHGQWLGDPDAYFEEAGLVVESESRQWHLSPADWEATLARHDRLAATGLHVLHLSPQRRQRDPDGVLALVERAYAAGLRTGPPPGVTVARVA